MPAARTPPPPPATLYAPAPQLEGKPPWKIEYLMVDPEIAGDWLTNSGHDDDFRNRPLNHADVGRTAQVMQRGGFVHYLPNGPICFDEKGILLNGKTRLSAVVESGATIGFIVFRGVPRWMFPYMDTGRLKTVKDVLYASHKMDKAGVIAAMKKVIRYEEFLADIRPASGWRHWQKIRDQAADLERIYTQREGLVDYYGSALAIRRGCKLTPTALMLFNFYQWHAWPQGRNELLEFLEALREGSNLKRGSAALSLRNFGRDEYCPTEGRMEIHLILLFRHFGAFAKDESIPRASWAYGQDMLPPFHPDGPAAAKKALRAALTPLHQVTQHRPT
jgi:hypothetical protein